MAKKFLNPATVSSLQRFPNLTHDDLASAADIRCYCMHIYVCMYVCVTVCMF